MKILITGGKTATALKLIKAFDGCEILLADYGDMPVINPNAYSFASLGTWNADVLAHNLLTKCLDYGADVLLPLYEAEIAAVSKSLVLFSEFDLKVLLPENPEFELKKIEEFCVFEEGKLIYTTVDVALENTQNLNGVYAFDTETTKLDLILIANPS